jgi:hypothetical protein
VHSRFFMNSIFLLLVDCETNEKGQMHDLAKILIYSGIIFTICSSDLTVARRLLARL